MIPGVKFQRTALLGVYGVRLNAKYIGLVNRQRSGLWLAFSAIGHSSTIHATRRAAAEWLVKESRK